MHKRLLFMIFLFVSGCATQPEISPQADLSSNSIKLSTIRNTSEPFHVRVKSNGKSLIIGELLNLELQSSISGFANLITISSSGKVSSLLEDVWINGNQSTLFPNQSAKVDYQLQPPSGKETYILIVSNKKLHWINNSDIYHHHLGLTSLSLNKEELIKRLSGITSQLPKSIWNIDYIELGLGHNA